MSVGLVKDAKLPAANQNYCLKPKWLSITDLYCPKTTSENGEAGNMKREARNAKPEAADVDLKREVPIVGSRPEQRDHSLSIETESSPLLIGPIT